MTDFLLQAQLQEELTEEKMVRQSYETALEEEKEKLLFANEELRCAQTNLSKEQNLKKCMGRDIAQLKVYMVGSMAKLAPANFNPLVPYKTQGLRENTKILL